MIKDRVVYGLVVLALTLLAFLAPGRIGESLFLVLAVACSSMCVFEFMNMTRANGLPGYPQTTAATVAALIGFICMRGMAARPGLAFTGLFGGVAFEVFVFLVFLGICVTMVARTHDFSLNLKRIFVSISVLALIMGTVGFIPRIYFLVPGRLEGRWLLLYLLLVVKSADVGAYIIGSLTANRPDGNHKLAPRISPKKSWEGLAGGALFAIVFALAFAGMTPAAELFGEPIFMRAVAIVVFAILCTLVGLAGDLGESLIKRATGAKDSGQLPGLGGVLDLLDSLTLAAPLFYLFVTTRLFS